jgi:DNA-binding NtrC family response regulator
VAPRALEELPVARVLIVEDNVALAAIWAEALGEEGFEVHQATTIDDAKLHLRERQIDVAIVDLVIDQRVRPDAYQGLILLADMFVRSLDGVAERPRMIVASGYFTANDDPTGLKDRLMPFKPDRILAKPVDLDHLIHTVRELAAMKAPA